MLLGIQKEHVMKTDDQHTWLHEIATPAQKLELLEVMENVVHQAKEVFEHCPTDFCLQHIGSFVIIFGGTNRLVWHIDSGFKPDRKSCTDEFLNNWDNNPYLKHLHRN
tara:strand:+ start:663 stop:986 length:324 start_codon:yes stop_codon:yes gene_type:complete